MQTQRRVALGPLHAGGTGGYDAAMVATWDATHALDRERAARGQQALRRARRDAAKQVQQGGRKAARQGSFNALGGGAEVGGGM
jgi:hypothetical protein